MKFCDKEFSKKDNELTYWNKKLWLNEGQKISVKRKNALYKIFRQHDTAYEELYHK